ncbi:hypothetical protein KIL84_020949 [Mauremys mutica]|uniref:Uncharacterized protein n=1 Tax=Mauremys mutica TaxID=74926 RepID=A0A9D3XBK6_9SAUR|nr:hypothetical protein KIL84_020949 [Mauremys mutica]
MGQLEAAIASGTVQTRRGAAPIPAAPQPRAPYLLSQCMALLWRFEPPVQRARYRSPECQYGSLWARRRSPAWWPTHSHSHSMDRHCSLSVRCKLPGSCHWHQGTESHHPPADPQWSLGASDMTRVDRRPRHRPGPQDAAPPTQAPLARRSPCQRADIPNGTSCSSVASGPLACPLAPLESLGVPTALTGT